MSRRYGAVRPKKNVVYSVEDVLSLYGITRNTLTNWIKAGLRPVDERRPQLFRGGELARFHKERALSNKRDLRAGEFNCVQCKSHVVPDIGTVKLDLKGRYGVVVRATCPDCGTWVSRYLSASTCNAYKTCIETNTSLHMLREEEGLAPAGIGTNASVSSVSPVLWNSDNERAIHAYQAFCGRYAIQTRDAHLAAIRAFEVHIGLKSFRQVKPADADRYRQELARRGRGESSRSTIRHHASHLSQFFKWLVDQDGYRQMNHSIPGYFELSRESSAKAIQPEGRPYPTMAQLVRVIKAMPARTLVEKRDRAIVALTCLFATRANATASLRLGDLADDLSKLRQDATRTRVKNSKSQVTLRFAVDEAFRAPLKAWIVEMRGVGLRNDDALFPPDRALANCRQLGCKERPPIPPWSTEDGVRRAFLRGSKAAGIDYVNPHAVRHALIAFGRLVCRSLVEEQAWSHNFGHSSLQVTQSHYAKMDDEQCEDVFSRLYRRDQSSEEEKDLLIQYYEHQLHPDSPEFKRAERLILERMKSRCRGAGNDGLAE